MAVPYQIVKVSQKPQLVGADGRPIQLTPAQEKARRLMVEPGVRHVLLRGGSRSGKTYIACRQILTRAIRVPDTTHLILRAHFNHLKHSIIGDTMPKVIRDWFVPQGWPSHDSMLNRTDWFLQLPNGAKVIYGGLDDKERTEKILGQEHSTIYLNEATQISYGSRNKAATRLAQNLGLRLLMLYDCNPPNMGHWLYKLFMKKVDPVSGQPLAHPDAYATMRLNPTDNMQNLSETYIEELESLPAKERRRFLEGEFLPVVDGALWTGDLLDKTRVSASQLPDMQRITINIDPSGTSGPEDKRSDEVGITVTARGTDKHGYVLEDASGRFPPERWARIACQLFDKWQADTVIGEKNYGGDMVRAVIQGFDSSVPVKLVTATRGKTVRAEPVASLYQQGKVHHLEILPEMEDQLCEFSTAGYQGETSPDRADSAIWGLTELMIGKKSYGMMDVL